ncbi:MAG: site-specific DNA-methyltransferase [Methanobrevibacter sp.]|jgi:DNA modification methylase|nr:site-specific DNA-methyltransferase [Candidatus Methanoflexus mossambicus]
MTNNDFQKKLVAEKDDFKESLNLTEEKIRKDLKKMKNIEGFPLGDIEDILEFSRSPYYLTCPNPFIQEFIEYYGDSYDEKCDEYKIKPFAGDVSEGKNDPVYMVHSYHTKVPHKAIIKYILHYTKEKDIIFDGFSGTGMTGVAAQLTNRIPILSEIGVAPALISKNYNDSFDYNVLVEIDNIINDLSTECSWMYKTNHINSDGQKKGIINYLVWSDVLICPSCGKEIVFWDVAVNRKEYSVKKEFKCSTCNINLKKTDCERATEEIFDFGLGNKIIQPKEVPVLVNYTYNRKRYEKIPDENDLNLIERIQNMEIPYWFPTNELPKGYNTKQPIKSHNFTNVHHFYEKRSLYILSSLYDKIIKSKNKDKNIIYLTSISQKSSKMNRWTKKHAGPLAGTLYIPSLRFETSIFNLLKNKYKIFKILIENSNNYKNKFIVTNQSSTDLSNVPKNCVDYIFTDPPFGSNLMYSELNFIWESWLKVFTNNKEEAIVNNQQNKDNHDYYELMTSAFSEMFRILKPNRWITVEFHNSKAEIWKLIQESIVKAGFMIAQVAVLDKKQGSFKQVTSPGSVKNDLIINAYKPVESFTERFKQKSGRDIEKEFVKMHLNNLLIESTIERTHQMLYSRIIAHYIQNGFEIQMDASDFYEFLNTNFEERNGFWFNEDQIEEYEKNLKLNENINDFDLNQRILGITDEKSAIIWLSQFLKEPKTYNDISIEFNKQSLKSDDKIPELKTILEDNFTTEDGKYRLPSSMERQEKEEVRSKRLLKEFKEIIETAKSSKKKIKEIRKEALTFGLMKLYKEKDIDTIKLLGERVDRKIIDSDDDISAIVDWAMYK